MTEPTNFPSVEKKPQGPQPKPPIRQIKQEVDKIAIPLGSNWPESESGEIYEILFGKIGSEEEDKQRPDTETSRVKDESPGSYNTEFYELPLISPVKFGTVTSSKSTKFPRWKVDLNSDLSLLVSNPKHCSFVIGIHREEEEVRGDTCSRALV
ncbi:hypothetical protein E2320_014351 [Naja naja]|nr:hypothetical protein E2320_014351 [Naja naja]